MRDESERLHLEGLDEATERERWEEATATTAQRIADVLRKMVAEYALDQESLHASWRCQYPDQYGACRCVDEFIVEYTAVIAALFDAERGEP